MFGQEGVTAKPTKWSLKSC